MSARSSVPPVPVAPVAGSRARFALALCLVFVLLAGARLVYIPRLGHGYDLEAYRRWTAAIQDHGLSEVFRTTNADYVGYHVILWVVARAYDERIAFMSIRDKPLRTWLKAPGIVGDALSTALIIALTLDLARRHPPARSPALDRLARRGRLAPAQVAALGAGLLWGLNPGLLYAGVYWGQNDSLTIAFMVAALWAALRRRPALASVLLGIGASLKPQPLVIAPVLAWVVWQRSGWRGLLIGGGAGALALLAGHAYFIFAGSLTDLIAVYRVWVVAPASMSYSAYNLWWPAQDAWHIGANDVAVRVGGLALTYGRLSTLLVLAVIAVTAITLRRRRDDTGGLIAAAFLVFGFFMVGAGAHERYDLPALALLAPVVALRGRWWAPLLLITLTLTINCALGLPLDRLYPQGRPHWLSLVAVALNSALLVGWTAALLRSNGGHGKAPTAGRGFARTTGLVTTTAAGRPAD